MITAKVASGEEHKKTLTQQICIRVFGANEGNRTPDLLITNELLYQLSYIGLVKNYIRA